MKSWVLRTLLEVRYSYWFIPSLMALAATLLAVVMVALDVYYLREIPKGYEWLFQSQPAGARAILSTVAGSTITVAGVVFSMTIMSVSHATANYGSRLLLKFLKDRRNQFALGTFTATFIYCLLVLRTVSGADSAAGSADFVPHLAVLGALGMALASVAVLIAFIHHIPDTINIGNVAAERGKELIKRLESMFPADYIAPTLKMSSVDLPKKVISEESGYLQTLDVDGLTKFCAKNDLVAKIIKPIGDFVYAGEELMQFRSNSEDDLIEQVDKLRGYFGMGDERSPEQDTRFLIEELSQISIRALSPGINDPFTAITCIDWLGNAVAHVINRAARSVEILDDDGAVRLIMPEFEFAELSNHIFQQLKPYVVEDLRASLHMAKIFNNLLSCTANSSRKENISDIARSYLSEALSACESDQDRARLNEIFLSPVKPNAL